VLFCFFKLFCSLSVLVVWFSFFLGYFLDRVSSFLPGAYVNLDPLTSSLYVSGTPGACCRALHVRWDGAHELFAWLASIFLILSISTWQIIGITDMNHHAHPCFSFCLVNVLDILEWMLKGVYGFWPQTFVGRLASFPSMIYIICFHGHHFEM
jgi:hypothetical protein